MQGVTVVGHPLVQHKLTLLREKGRSTKSFRELCRELGILMCYEVTRDLPLGDVDIEPPWDRCGRRSFPAKSWYSHPSCAPAPRSSKACWNWCPAPASPISDSTRDPATLMAVEYYFKAPLDVAERLVIVIAPVIATANTAVAAVDRLKERGARDIRYVCLIAVPGALERLRGIHPDVPVWTAAIDDHLDAHGYIVPGLGDAGDRAYGTR